MIPTPASGAGYNLQTYGPQLELGKSWFNHNLYVPPVANQSIQNSDGSVYLPGSNYGICTIENNKATGTWQGTAFGGGAYVEALLSFPPSSAPLGAFHPSLWLQDAAVASPNAITAATQWPGQAAGYGDSVEPDIMELDAQNPVQYGFGMHNWYGPLGAAIQQVHTSVGPYTISPKLFYEPNRFGWLWVPATATSPGSATWYFNGVAIGNVSWSQYNPATPPPATPAAFVNPYAVMDTRQFCIVVNTHALCPMLVQSVGVWQGSAAGNVSQ